jgi:argininosuccinate lyase
VTVLRDGFGGPLGADMRRFASSFAADLELLDEDVAGSLAHVTMLAEVGLLGAEEARTLTAGLRRVRDELARGECAPGAEAEDVHMAVEARLAQLVGEVAGRLHTARSRNDQVATDVRLWLKRRIHALDRALAALVATLLDRVEADGRTLLPGYTHLQRGQPILLGHHLLAHAWALGRDRERLADARTRVDRCPLGAAALAGTPHPIDRRRTAELLGFAGPVPNAMDAVAARDHVQEVVAACAICMIQLSRMAEELVLWSSSEFALVRLSDGYATGSSIMPNKRNPDAAELVRGEAATVAGDLQAVLGLVRALPLAYNRDLQLERRALFHAVLTTTTCVEILTGVWRTLEVRRERFERELYGDPCLATELADLLAAEGVPFREAHAAVARAVRHCVEQGGGLELLTPEVGARFHPALGRDLRPWLDPRAAAERRTSLGGTAWSEIVRQVAELRAGVAG